MSATALEQRSHLLHGCQPATVPISIEHGDELMVAASALWERLVAAGRIRQLAEDKGVEHGLRPASDGVWHEDSTVDAVGVERATRTGWTRALRHNIGPTLARPRPMVCAMPNKGPGYFSAAFKCPVAGATSVSAEQQLPQHKGILASSPRVCCVSSFIFYSECGKERRLGNAGAIGPAVGGAGHAADFLPPCAGFSGNAAVAFLIGQPVHDELHQRMNLLAAGPEVG